MKPYLDPRWVRELGKTHPYMWFSWDEIKQRWVVWQKNPYSEPWLVMYVENDDKSYRPVDWRTILQLRETIWHMGGRYMTWLWGEVNKADYRRQKRQEDYDDLNLQMHKEAEPLIKTLNDAGHDPYGRSKFKFPGFGESKINALEAGRLGERTYQNA